MIMKSLITSLLLALSSICYSQQYLTLCDEDSLSVFTYTTSTGTSGTYFWSIDGGIEVIDGPSYQVVWGLFGDGWHTLSVRFEDNIGCEAEPVTLNVNVDICATSTMWAPNCFTPDGDENNNIWQPIGVNYREPYFFIMNRWGNLVFESYDLNIGWDGSFNGKMCQDGVYVYSLRWKDYNGKTYNKHGHVTLLR